RAHRARPPSLARARRAGEHDPQDVERQDPARAPGPDGARERAARSPPQPRRRVSASAALEIGCHLPVYGPAATRETLVTFARRMEALGYDSLWVSDHIVIPYEIRSRYLYNAIGDFSLFFTTNFFEPFAVMALV